MSRQDQYASPPPNREPYFPPPPTSAYGEEPDGQPAAGYDSNHHPWDGAPRHPYGRRPNDSSGQLPPLPRSEYGYAGVSEKGWGGGPRGPQSDYAPSEPRPNENNMLAPYDEEKAYAEYTNAYGPPDGQGYSDAGGGRPREDAHERRRYDDERRRYEEEKRRDGDGSYERERERDRDRGYDDRNDSPSPNDALARRRYSDRYDDGARLRKQRSPPDRPRGKDVLRQGDGQRGIGATLLGGAAGAFLGNELDKGALGMLGGALVGAIGANVVEKQVDKLKEGKEKGVRENFPSRYEDGRSDTYSGSRESRGERSESFRPRREAERPRGPKQSQRGSSSDGYSSDDSMRQDQRPSNDRLRRS